MRMRFKTLTIIAFLLMTMFTGGQAAQAQNQGYDVFIPISKYITQGNYDALSTWFADNLDVSVLSRSVDASRSQARQIIKAFFEEHTPRSFIITHTAGRANMKYVIGDLNAGGENYRLTIFVICQNDKYKIQQLKIDSI